MSDAREEALAPFVLGGLTLAGLFLTARTLAAFGRIFTPYLAVPDTAWLEAGFVLGQIPFQWTSMTRRSWPERLRYAGLALGISVLGAVLLWPILLLHGAAPVTLKTAIGCWVGVTALCFVVHWLFVGYMKLPRALGATWLAYRLLVVFLLVRPHG